MKKTRIRLISLVWVLILCTGCSQVRITSGGAWMMKLEKSELSKEEVKMIALTQSSLFQQFYVPLAGSGFWNQVTETGEEFESYVKNTIVFEEAAALTVLNAIADSWELELTDQEQERIHQATQSYMKTTTKDTRAYIGGSYSDINQLISKYVRARNVIQLLSEDVNMEVSDNEMRVMDIQMIVLSDLATAAQIKAQLEAGADFLSMAKQYSKSSTYEYSVRRGELNESLEKEVFQMDSGEVSQVIPVEETYYIVNCVDDYNEQLSEENRFNIQQQRIYEQWMNTIEEFMFDRSLEMNQSKWENLSLEIKTDAQDSELFAIIEEYFP